MSAFRIVKKYDAVDLFDAVCKVRWELEILPASDELGLLARELELIEELETLESLIKCVFN